MDTLCLAWAPKDNKMDRFIDGPKFYLPIRCQELRVEGQCICANHLRRKMEPLNNKNHPSRYWGLVTEPIQNIERKNEKTQKSILAFSPWFMEKAKHYTLSHESMVRVKGLMKKAVEGLPEPVAVPEIVTEVAAVAPVKKTRGPSKKKVAAPLVEVPVVEEVLEEVTEAPLVPLETTKVKVKVKVKAAPKEKSAPKVKAPTKSSTKGKEPEVPPVAVIEGVIEEDVAIVSVKPFSVNSKLYYIDSVKKKLYDRAKDGTTKGIYQGRWDALEEKIITTIPDSDAEDS